VSAFGYPLRWHQIEREPGAYDWSSADSTLCHLRESGAHVVVDLVHHTSHPEWLEEGFRDRRFGPAYVRYAEAAALRYPWLPAYTLFNEPLATPTWPVARRSGRRSTGASRGSCGSCARCSRR
jgi:GH35 family endo-1,4-beta-xylanase